MQYYCNVSFCTLTIVRKMTYYQHHEVNDKNAIPTHLTISPKRILTGTQSPT